jgi:hypothetical protein
MILAVSQLAQPFGRPGGPRRRHVDAHDAAWQVIDTPDGLVEVACKRAPTCRDGQGVEDRCQPIIRQIPWWHLDAETPPEGALVDLPPRLDTSEPVVALGEDEGQPDDCGLAETQTLPMAIGEKVVVQ